MNQNDSKVLKCFFTKESKKNQRELGICKNCDLCEKSRSNDNIKKFFIKVVKWSDEVQGLLNEKQKGLHELGQKELIEILDDDEKIIVHWCNCFNGARNALKEYLKNCNSEICESEKKEVYMLLKLKTYFDDSICDAIKNL